VIVSLPKPYDLRSVVWFTDVFPNMTVCYGTNQS